MKAMKFLSLAAAVFFSVKILHVDVGYFWAADKTETTDGVQKSLSQTGDKTFETKEEAREDWFKYADFFGLNTDQWSYNTESEETQAQ